MVGMGDGKMGVGRGGAGVVDVDAKPLPHAPRQEKPVCRNSTTVGAAAAASGGGHDGGDQRWGTDEMSGGGGIWQWGQRWDQRRGMDEISGGGGGGVRGGGIVRWRRARGGGDG